MPLADVFLNFLRGMETAEDRCHRIGQENFLNFLRGMETKCRSRPRSLAAAFLNFLRGMETALRPIGILRADPLPKLP